MSLPDSMRAVGLKGPGGSDQLFIETVDRPEPRAGELLLEVAACGVNRPDVLQRLGLYPPPADANPRLGLEVSGRVVKLGSGVDPSMLGREVMALCNGGGYAQYVCVPAAQCMNKPESVSLVEAASLPETYLTVWQNVFLKGELKAGMHLLVHGGSSGIGSAAIQLAAAHGAIVHVTVGSQEKQAYCARLGAHHVYNYRTEDWAQQVKANSPAGADLILDMVAGPYLDRDLDCVSPEGQVIVIALLGGRHATVDAARLMTKQVRLTGSTLRPRSPEFKAMLARQVEREVKKRFELGQLKTTITARFKLNDVAQAHELMESGALMGKIILELEENR